MENRLKKYMEIQRLPYYVVLICYFYGAWSIADWVVEHVGSSPSSSFYGLLTIGFLMYMFYYFYRLLQNLINKNDVS